MLGLYSCSVSKTPQCPFKIGWAGIPRLNKFFLHLVQSLSECYSVNKYYLLKHSTSQLIESCSSLISLIGMNREFW